MPEIAAFWPFLNADPRSVPEPGLHKPARYRFGDRIAAALTHYNMPDDILYLVYEGMAEKEMPDLDAMLATDITNWRRLDGRCDVTLADHLERRIRVERLFAAPNIPGGDLIRALAERLLDMPVINALAPRADVLAELDALMRGYVGHREELPVHPLVARHFQLAWWSPSVTYRWFGNRLGFKDYILDYITTVRLKTKQFQLLVTW